MTNETTKHIIVITVPYFGNIVSAIALARNLSGFAEVSFATLRKTLAHIKARGELTAQDQQTFNVLPINDDLPEGLSEADYMRRMSGRLGEYSLEYLQKPFILSLQSTLRQFLPAKLEAAIESQFEDADRRGLILKWAPQKTILAHLSVQMFVSHCGWISTIESIYYGKPVVGWPAFADQLENSLLLEKIGMGISLHTIESSGVAGGPKERMSADQIVDAANKIGASGGGRAMSTFAEAAQIWSSKLKAAIAPGGTSEAALRSLVENCTKEGQCT